MSLFSQKLTIPNNEFFQCFYRKPTEAVTKSSSMMNLQPGGGAGADHDEASVISAAASVSSLASAKKVRAPAPPPVVGPTRGVIKKLTPPSMFNNFLGAVTEEGSDSSAPGKGPRPSARSTSQQQQRQQQV